MDNSSQPSGSDRAAIEEMRYRLAQYLDQKDWAELSDLFTDEVHIDFPDYGMAPQTIPRQTFVDSFRQSLGRPDLVTQHLCTNARIRIAGNTAVCVTNWAGYHFMPNFAGGDEFTLRGQYTDALTRTGDGWRISGVAFKLAYTTGNAGLLAG